LTTGGKAQRGEATLADVARTAGVSLATAARVLRRDNYPVSNKLKARVEAAAQSLGYVPNMLARNLRGARGSSLGLIVGDMRDPYFGKIAACITAEAYHASLLALVANMHRNPSLEIAMCRQLWEHRVDGLILAGGGFDQMSRLEDLQHFVDKLQAAGVVVVSLSERKLSVPCFSADNEQIGRDIGRSLRELGHERIAVAAGPAGGFVGDGRLRGLRQVLAQDGILPHVVHTEFSQEGGTQAADAFLQAIPRPSAVVALSDSLAVNVMDRLRERGLRTPDDISIVSVGDTDYCDISTPRLTSMDTSIEASCVAAIRHIRAVWAGETPPAPAPFDHRLVQRDSLGAAPTFSFP